MLAFLPDLYRSARALVVQQADAEDLVHDTCLKAFAAFDSARLQNRSACQAWLRRILVNGFRDIYRREQRSPVKAVAGDTICRTRHGGVHEAAVSVGSQPDAVVAETEFESAIDTAFDRLPPEVRTVAALHIVSGLAYKDIASLTDQPIGTVMSRIARARRLLRAALSEHITDDASVANAIGPRSSIRHMRPKKEQE